MTPGRTARLLGYAGLLPQLAACGLLALASWLDGRSTDTIALRAGLALAIAYPAVILAFVGGIWWGFAMRQDAEQARLAATAIVPPLVSAAAVAAAGLGVGSQPILLILGVALIATVAVDRRLAADGIAPAGWLMLLAPLSLGLGGLTITAALLVP